MKLLPLIRSAHQLIVRLAPRLQSPLLLGVRLHWGWAFFETGRGKLLNLAQTASYFADLGLPLPKLNAFLAGSTECIGGVLLLLGLAERPAALPLIFTMLVAYLTADMEAVRSIFSAPDRFVSADPFLFLLASAIVLAFGPGRLSLDHLIQRKSSAPASAPRECSSALAA